jgi:hypothetical protein
MATPPNHRLPIVFLSMNIQLINRVSYCFGLILE